MGVRDVIFVGALVGAAGALAGGALRPTTAVPGADRPVAAARPDPGLGTLGLTRPTSSPGPRPSGSPGGGN